MSLAYIFLVFVSIFIFWELFRHWVVSNYMCIILTPLRTQAFIKSLYYIPYILHNDYPNHRRSQGGHGALHIQNAEVPFGNVIGRILKKIYKYFLMSINLNRRYNNLNCKIVIKKKKLC